MTIQKKSPLSRRLMKYRKVAGYATPADLAKDIGNPKVTKSTIVNLEQGRKSDVTLTEACLIAKALGIPVFSLVCDIDEPFGRPDLDGFDNWTNTDLLNLFTVPDGLYGPVTEAAAIKLRQSLLTEKDQNYIDLTYTWVRYLSGGIRSFYKEKSDLLIEEAKPRHGDNVDRLRAHCIVAQNNVEISLLKFKELNIAVPDDVIAYANQVLDETIPKSDEVKKILKKYEEKDYYLPLDDEVDYQESEQ